MLEALNNKTDFFFILTARKHSDRIMRVKEFCVKMDTKELITKDGNVKEAMMGGMFRIELDDGETALASLSGKIRKFKIRILPGDRVKVEFSPHDLTRGRISYRYK